jgi:hypothetical protein
VNVAIAIPIAIPIPIPIPMGDYHYHVFGFWALFSFWIRLGHKMTDDPYDREMRNDPKK